MANDNGGSRTSLRVGQAAEMLQVSIETLRRWESEGRLRVTRSSGGQRLVPVTEVTRLLAERRTQAPERRSSPARLGTGSQGS
jgi:excisionase family DNA binding protein